MSRAYYNEFDPHAAAWLRELIGAGLIASGDVDERSIEDVRPDELAGYTQCHFFAGIGGWSLALRSAGWPDDRPVWTGSCPCQPFSAAGKGGGFDDERHLWPAFYHLVEHARPPVVFGEQVASPAGLVWFASVQADLEGTDYSIGVADLPAASVGAPHIRQRIYWLAESSGQRQQRLGLQLQPGTARLDISETRGRGEAGELADDGGPGLQERVGDGRVQREALGALPRQAAVSGGNTVELGNAGSAGSRGHSRAIPSAQGEVGRSVRSVADESESSGTTFELGNASDYGIRTQHRESRASNEQHGQLSEERRVGFWSDCDWIACRDGKTRPVEPGAFPLAHGVPGRVGLLRGYGNAIVPQVATAFIQAYDDLSLYQEIHN